MYVIRKQFASLQVFVINAAAGRAFSRLREDLRRVGERFTGGSGTNNQFQTHYRPLAGSRCSRSPNFLRAKKHSCWSADNEDLLVRWQIVQHTHFPGRQVNINNKPFPFFNFHIFIHQRLSDPHVNFKFPADRFSSTFRIHYLEWKKKKIYIYINDLYVGI